MTIDAPRKHRYAATDDEAILPAQDDVACAKSSLPEPESEIEATRKHLDAHTDKVQSDDKMCPSNITVSQEHAPEYTYKKDETAGADDAASERAFSDQAYSRILLVFVLGLWCFLIFTLFRKIKELHPRSNELQQGLLCVWYFFVIYYLVPSGYSLSIPSINQYAKRWPVDIFAIKSTISIPKIHNSSIKKEQGISLLTSSPFYHYLQKINLCYTLERAEIAHETIVRLILVCPFS